MSFSFCVRWQQVAWLLAPLVLSSCYQRCPSTADFVGHCGDDQLGFSEDCDDAKLRGQTCETLGYRGGGQLRCDPLCRFDTTDCVDVAICGDGLVEYEEECDGEELGGATCTDVGLTSNRLRCNASCKLDYYYCSCEQCDNGWDDDNDGLVDCDDPDCLGVDGCPTELCYDGHDNNGDGLVDCADPECATNAPHCNAGLFMHENDRIDLCGNGLDDDGDGLADAQDPDCFGRRGALFLRDTNCGLWLPGDGLMVTVRAYADATDLQSLTIRVTLPPEIPWARAFQRCTYDPASHEITAWFETLRHGDATEILFEAQLSPTLEAGDLACAQATLSSATPLSQWVTDDPFTPESLDPTCLVVQQH